ncbi:hypothetical protein CRG98_005821, partial [Punica granatum]
MISICASGRDEDTQDNPLPFVIDYTPKEPTVGFTGNVALPALFVVDIPAREPYSDGKVPWTYQGSIGSVEQQFSVMGVTRSGRVYENPAARDKGKAPATEIGAAPESSPFPSKRVTEEEAEAFMKIMKASEYKVVEQMAKSPAHISLLAFLLDSKPHREALLRVLTSAQCLQMNNYIIGRVMIDNGSALNVCPVTTLKQMNVDLNRVRLSKTAVRAFDGSRREVNGEIDLLIDVGPCSFSITFQVLDIPNAFSLLLGRPWIHSAGAVPSSLHQRLKFIVEEKLITVKGEEDYAIYKETAVPYISVGDDENLPFHSFKTISIIRDYGEIGPSRTDRMIGKVLLRNNYVPGTGLGARGQGISHPIEIEEYKHRRGLGFRPSCHEIIEACRGHHLRRLAAHYGRLNRGISVPPLHSNPNPRHFDSNLFQEHLGEPQPVYFGEEIPEDSQVPEIEESLRRLEDHQITSVEPTEEINVGTEEEPRTLKIGTALDPTQREYQEVFAWSYADMPGLDPSIVEHFLPLDTEKFPPKRQQLRRQRASLLLRIKEEVVKQINAGFLEVCNYFEWVANIVLDNFPLPHIDVLVDNTARHAQFSFMDGFSGYNQIRMAEKDKLKTTFTTMWGTFCYRVMPFGLKNAGATYQRAMVTLFHDMMHKEVEVYVDDMIAKSKEGEDHLVNLKRLFDRLREYKLRLNPAKCTFSARSGKLLGFVVSERDIEADPDKVKAIKELPPPSTVREVRGFLGRLNYIARFIANLTDKCQLLFRLLRKNAAMEWDHECQKAFDSIKAYLIQPPILIPPAPNRPLILYLTVRRQSLGCMLGQEDESTRTERAIYYLSKKFTEGESNYPEIEKMCCAMYEACIVGLQAAINFKVKELEVFGDSMLTIFQTLGQWKTKDAKLVPYHEYLEELAKNFEKISFTYTLRAKNQFVDALATLASMASISEGNIIEPLEIEIKAITLASVTAKAVARFLRRDVIARYGVPATIITDNAKNLNNKVIDELCAQFKIRHRNSTPYCPQMNGAVEAANKNIKKIIEKMT